MKDERRKNKTEIFQKGTAKQIQAIWCGFCGKLFQLESFTQSISQIHRLAACRVPVSSTAFSG